MWIWYNIYILGSNIAWRGWGGCSDTLPYSKFRHISWEQIMTEYRGLSVLYNSENIRFQPNADSMLGQRCRQSTNIKSTLVKCPVFVGKVLRVTVESYDAYTRVDAKYIGTCTYLFLSTFFRILACSLYLSFKNVLVLLPKYITKYLILEDKYIASTSVSFKKQYIIIYFFSYSVQ